MSTLSRMLAPSAPSGLADQVVAALSNLDRSAPQDLSETLNDAEGEPRLTLGPAGLGTSAARAFLADVTQTGTGGPGVAAPGIDRSDIDRSDIDRSGIDQSGIGWAAPIPGVRAPTFVLPNGVRPSALIVPDEENTDDDAVPALFCPGPVRDDPALGDEVNRRLIDWADEVGIYPGEVERLHAANFGRLMMLTHPATDDPDRLLAAARCVLAEWATDDHFLDEESMGADATRIGSRLAVTYAAVDPADLPVGYAAQLDRALSEEPVAVA